MVTETELKNLNNINPSREQQVGVGMSVISDLIYAQEIISSRGNLIEQVNSLCIDSRKVVPGSLFFAIDGQHTNGVFYIEEAIDRGAVGIITEMPLPKHYPVSFIQVKNVREQLANISRRFYNHPDVKLRLTGITGTNGKSTTCKIIEKILKTAKYNVKTVGNIGKPILSTTYKKKIYLILEASSYQLQYSKLFRSKHAAILNISPDHLERHKNLKNYIQIKSKIFFAQNNLDYSYINSSNK